VDRDELGQHRARGRYQSIVGSFEQLSTDEDPDVRALAAAGVEIFAMARDKAAARERLERIRGLR
jgi:hypothetical protein